MQHPLYVLPILIFQVGMNYYNLRETLNSRPRLIPTNVEPSKYITDFNKDWYTSLYYYNEKHKSILDEKGTLAGIRDTVTNRVFLDFDSETDLELARKDAVEMAHRLINTYGVNQENLNAFFSGKKGFSLEFTIDQTVTPDQMLSIVKGLGDGLSTLDKKVFDANRIVRVPNTRHQSGLYKIPLELYELDELTIEAITSLAKSRRLSLPIKSNPITIDHTALKTLLVTPKPKEERTAVAASELDYTNKPKFLTNCRWSLQNGRFSQGIRSNALLSLASTYKNLGFDIEHVYRLLKGVAELQARFTGSERYSDEEIYNNIVTQVFRDSWQGGQYTCKKEGWLQEYCESLGAHSCSQNEEEDTTLSVDGIFPLFDTYVNSLEKNVLTTGIVSLDENVKLMVGTSNAILASPGVGKCLGKDTPVIMFDGSIKKVQDVIVGDVLMGDDSTPRNVLSTCTGVENLYRF